jgi:hypothetical protein
MDDLARKHSLPAEPKAALESFLANFAALEAANAEAINHDDGGGGGGGSGGELQTGDYSSAGNS